MPKEAQARKDELLEDEFDKFLVDQQNATGFHADSTAAAVQAMKYYFKAYATDHRLTDLNVYPAFGMSDFKAVPPGLAHPHPRVRQRLRAAEPIHVIGFFEEMSVISGLIDIRTDITDMKYRESPLIPANRLDEAADIGAKLTRLRTARKLRQLDVAMRAGLSRSTAALIEKGDPGRTVAQILRYLEAIAPGLPLLALLQMSDPSLKALEQQEATQRVRPLSATELQKLDF